MTRSSITNVISRAIILFLVAAVLISGMTGSVSANENTVTLQDGEQYWYGQFLTYNSASVNDGENWTLRGQTTGNSTTVTADSQGLEFNTTNLGAPSDLQNETVELVDPSGTVVLTSNLSFQTLNPQPYSNSPVKDAGSSSSTILDIDSNRSNYTFDILVTDSSGQLNGEQLAGLSGDLERLDSNTAEYTGASGLTTVSLDFQGIPPGTYDLTYSTEDSVEVNSGSLVAISRTQSITVQDAVGSVEGEVNTQDNSYTGNINLTLSDQNSTNEYTKTISGVDGSAATYSFSNIQVSDYDLTVSANRHQTETITGISVNDGSTTTVNSVTLPYADTTIDATVDVNTTGGGSFNEQMTVTVTQPSGNIEGEKTFNDGDTKQFIASGTTGDYTVTVDSRSIEETSQTVNLGKQGVSKAITLNPNELETGTIEVNASTEEPVEEIRVTVTGTGPNTTGIENTLRIQGDSGTTSTETIVGSYELTIDALNHESVTESSVNVSADSTTSRTVSLSVKNLSAEDKGQYWVGQQLDFSQYVSSGDSVRFRNQDNNDVYNPSVSDPDNFIVDTEVLNSGPGTGEYVFSVNDSPTINFTLSEQTLDSQFTSDVVIDGDTESSLTISSERSSTQEVVITEINGPNDNTIDGSSISQFSSEWEQTGSNSFATVSSQEAFFNLNFADAPFDLTEGTYTFNFEVADTTATSTADLTVTADSERNISDLESDRTIQDSGLFWTGQVISLGSDTVTQGEAYRILKDDSLVEELSPRDSDGKLIFDTSFDSYGAGDYSIEDANGDVVIEEFLVRDQDLSAEFEDNTVLNTGSQTDTDISFESNRSTYSVIVTQESGSQNLSASDLANRIQDADIKEVELDGETAPRAVITSVGSSPEPIDLDNVEEGSYEFSFDVVDSTASASSTIEVRGLTEGQPEFSKRVYEANQGDIAEFDVIMSEGVDEATLILGEPSIGYTAELELTDSTPNSSTIATIKLDTSKGGQGIPNEAYSVETNDGETDTENNSTDSEDSTISSSVSLSVTSETNISVDGMLRPGRYLMQLETEGTERDISALGINKLGAENRGVYVLPEITSIEERRDEINGNTDDSEGTDNTNSDSGESDTETVDSPFFGESDPIGTDIPNQDTGVVAIKIDGLGSQLYDSELNSADFEEGSPLAKDSGVYVTIEETGDTKLNREEKSIPVSAMDYQFNEDADMLYFTIQPNSVSQAKVGKTFDLTFNVDERNGAISEERDPIEVTQEFTITEESVDWGPDPIQVEPASDQQIIAQTQYTPQTTMDMVVLSYNASYPLFYTEEVEVSETGTVSASFDFTSAPKVNKDDSEYRVILRNVTDSQKIAVVDDATRPDFATTETPESVELTINVEDPGGNTITADITVDGNTQEVSDSGTFEVPTEQEVTIDASAEEFQSTSSTISVGTENLSETITMQPVQQQTTTEEPDNQTESPTTPTGSETYRVDVLAEDKSNGETIEGAVVTLDDTQQQTGSDGTIPVLVEGSGEYTLTVSAEGYSTVEETITVDSDGERTVGLEPVEETNNGGSSNPTPATETDVRSDGQDGFGIIVALLALLSVFVARRISK